MAAKSPSGSGASKPKKNCRLASSSTKAERFCDSTHQHWQPMHALNICALNSRILQLMSSCIHECLKIAISKPPYKPCVQFGKPPTCKRRLFYISRHAKFEARKLYILLHSAERPACWIRNRQGGWGRLQQGLGDNAEGTATALLSSAQAEPSNASTHVCWLHAEQPAR